MARHVLPGLLGSNGADSKEARRLPRGAAEQGALSAPPWPWRLALRRRFTGLAVPANSFHACGNETPQKRSGEESPTGASRWRTHRSAMLAVKDEEFEIAVQLAAYYVADATEGRLDNGLASNFKSGNKRKLYCCLVQTHIAWHVMVMAACVLHSLLIILEPPPGQSCARGWENVAELFLVLVYVADILLKVAYMGAGTFLSLRGSKIWQTTYAALTAILFLDAALAPCTRLSRPLRPIMLVLRSRSVRNFYTTVLRICPSLLKVLMLLLFILTASSLGMARLLRGSGTRYFTSSLATFQEMAILLLTQDNYKDLLHDLSDHGGLASLLVFFTFVVVGVLFLMQLVLGTVIDTYMEEAQEELRSKRVKQAKGLMRAFSVLDLRKEGHLRQRAFDRLIQKLRPSDSPFERHLKFSLLSNKYKSMVPASSGPSTPARSREDLLREMEVVENLGFEVAGSKETGIERLREKFLGRGQADVVDEELLRQVQKEVPLRDLLSLHRSKSGSNFAGSNPTTPGSGVH